MSLSKVMVISNALALMGKKPILSLDGAGDLVVAAEQAFDFLFPSSLAESQWRFACRILPLSRENIMPFENSLVSFSYTYVYQLPADYIRTIRVWPQSYDWEIFENKKLYCNNIGPMEMEYVFMPLITKVPDYFWKYFVYEIAAYLSLSSAQKTDYYNVLEQKRASQYAIASAIDAGNRPNTPIVSAPMITQRFVANTVTG